MFKVGWASFNGYGFLIGLGVVVGVYVSLRLAKRFGVEKKEVWEGVTWVIGGGLVGARVYHVVDWWPYYMQRPERILAIWQGGMGIYGAVLGGIVGLWWYSRKLDKGFLKLADLGIMGLPLYLLSYASMGLWQYFIQDYFWDIYVSPEHDTPKSIIIKTFVCHIPNVAFTLGFLIIWNNYGIFITFFVSALVASTIFQKFPPPWAKGDFHAPMTKPGIAGLPHGAGYLGDLNKDKKNNAESFLK